MKYGYMVALIIMSCSCLFSNENNSSIEHNLSDDSAKLCFAIANKNVKYCSSIEGHDNKSSCFGIVKQNTGYCDMVQDSDIKHKCLAIALSDITTCDKIQDQESKEHCVLLFSKMDKDIFTTQECDL